MSVISYSNLKIFASLKIKRPYLYLKQEEGVLILSVTSKEKGYFPHKFKLVERCSCLDNEDYEYSFVNLNTKILVPWDKWDFIVKKYGIILTKKNHNCLSSKQKKEPEKALEEYWKRGKRKLVKIILNN